MKPGRILTTILVLAVLILGAVYTVGAEEVQTYTVKPGDTLWSISKRFYGDDSLWPKLWEMNKYNTTNPHQISVGDVLNIYPLDRLMQAQSPPAPPPVQTSLYDRGKPYDVAYPKYFTFVADPDGIANTGVLRMKIKKLDPVTGQLIEKYYEIREVGEVIASKDRGYEKYEMSGEIHGRLLLAYSDDVYVRFTEDVAKILDSATHEDPDPYFREWPIYGIEKAIKEPDRDRHDFDRVLGNIHQYKGRLTIIARIETLSPMSEAEERKLSKDGGRNLTSEPVSYVARITQSERVVEIGDKLFLFKELIPGPDREIGGRKLHKAGQYQDVTQ
jgi:hypothetical protein